MIEIFTDATHSESNKKGFWAFIILHNSAEIARHHGNIWTQSINVVELLACNKALEWLDDWPGLDDSEIILYTDSKGVVGKIDRLLKKELHKIHFKHWNLIEKTKWRWIPRQSHPKNILCDKICKYHRKRLEYRFVKEFSLDTYLEHK